MEMGYATYGVQGRDLEHIPLARVGGTMNALGMNPVIDSDSASIKGSV